MSLYLFSNNFFECLPSLAEFGLEFFVEVRYDFDEVNPVNFFYV